MLTTAACPAASRYRFPSEASIQQPEALLAMGYVARKLRGNSAEESDISTPGPILTDRARTQIKGEASEAIAPANHRDVLPFDRFEYRRAASNERLGPGHRAMEPGGAGHQYDDRREHLRAAIFARGAPGGPESTCVPRSWGRNWNDHGVHERSGLAVYRCRRTLSLRAGNTRAVCRNSGRLAHMALKNRSERRSGKSVQNLPGRFSAIRKPGRPAGHSRYPSDWVSLRRECPRSGSGDASKQYFHGNEGRLARVLRGERISGSRCSPGIARRASARTHQRGRLVRSGATARLCLRGL